MKFSYGWEKLHLAMHSLAGQGSQSERIVNAVIFNLVHITPENDLPEIMRIEFEEFMDEITSVQPSGNEGTAQATVNSLDEIGCSRIIHKIIHFYDTICRHCEPL